MKIDKEKNIVVVEFPLTQAKRSWKIRTDGKISADKILGYQIQKGNFLEWMVEYEELRDILCCIKKVSVTDFQKIFKKFNQSNPPVEKAEKAEPREPIRVGSITVDRQLLGKQRKPSESFPYIFILFSLFYETISEETKVFLIDKSGEKITNTNGYKIKCGDSLIWLPSTEEISKIIEEFAILSKKHKDTAKREIFDRMEKLENLLEKNKPNA